MWYKFVSSVDVLSFKSSMWIPRKSFIKLGTEVLIGVRDWDRNLVYENFGACSLCFRVNVTCTLFFIYLNAPVLTPGMKGIKAGL